VLVDTNAESLGFYEVDSAGATCATGRAAVARPPPRSCWRPPARRRSRLSTGSPGRTRHGPGRHRAGLGLSRRLAGAEATELIRNGGAARASRPTPSAPCWRGSATC
jgi:hypothetical protein